MGLDTLTFRQSIDSEQRKRRNQENMQSRQEIGQRLALEASRLNLSGTKAARLVGCSRRTWLHYEGGVTTPDASMLLRLDALGFDVLYLVTGRVGRPRNVSRGSRVVAMLK